MSFVHLHNHTHYSFQQALGDPHSLAKRAKELGQTAIAITDNGNLYGAFEFYQACVEEWIQPIIGVEFTISKKWRANREKDNEFFEIVLLAKNEDGYRNLIQMVTISQLEWYWNGRPRIDFEVLEKYSQNLIGLSGSMYGEIGQCIITGRDDEYIVERIEYYRKILGGENFFLEIQEHPDRPMQPKINDTIIRIAKNYNYEIVGTNNAYYLTVDDAEVQDMMSAVASNREIDDPDRATLMNGNYSVRPSREMEELFIYAPKAYENTTKIAEMINLEIVYWDYKIPVFPLSDEQNIEYENYKNFVKNHNENNEEKFEEFNAEQWLLRKMCIEGLNYRFGFGLDENGVNVILQKVLRPKIEKKLTELSVEDLHEIAENFYSEEKKNFIKNFDEKQLEILSRLEYELTVVNIMWFNGYFCIVADYIDYGKKNGVPVGPGRGSAAGALLAYLSGITDIDPLRYNLLFERFLNPSRVSMPDIDVDFSDEWRDQVLAYVREKYGKDRVAQVCTFGTLAAKAAVKDAGKALGIPFADMNNFAKLIPTKPWITLKQALEESPEFKAAYEEGWLYTKVVDSAMRLEWTVRQLGVHACAVIIAPEPMTHFCPLQPPPKDPTTTVTQFSAHPLEDLGLLKMDFLGLRNLAILDRAKKIVKEVHGVDINLLKIDFEDPKVLALFGEGDMTGVFQFESMWMRKYLQQLKPSSFEDLIAMVSLYRPGPLQYIPEFIDRKFGRKLVEYPHPSLEAILKPTYGIAVYQEQIMQLVQAFAGFSLGEADILRRAIGKKKYDLLMEQREKFIIAAEEQWHPKDLAVYIFDEIIEPFAGYGFNKSHAACYSMIAYQTAYMKAYYPTESMVALMISDEEDIDRVRMEISEAKAKGLEVLPPDVNESRKHFTYIDNKTIRFGLKAIKGLWDGPIETIRNAIKDWKFTSLKDFIERTGSDVINKKSLEALIYSGALDNFGERASLLENIPQITAFFKEHDKKNETSQMGLFDMEDAPEDELVLKKVEPMSFEDRMKGEKFMIGYPVSGHPLDWLDDFIISKSKNITIVQDWFDKLRSGAFDENNENNENNENLENIENPENISEKNSEENPEKDDKKSEKNFSKNKKDENIATLIGLVSEVRVIPTKTGQNLIFAKVQSVGFDFTVSVFGRDYKIYADKLKEDTIVVVNGKLRFDEERWEVSLSPITPFHKADETVTSDSVKVFSISQFHDFAKTAWVNVWNKFASKRFDLVVPPYWTKENLFDLRAYLETAEIGDTEIFLIIKNQEKSTKFYIKDTQKLTDWVKNYS